MPAGVRGYLANAAREELPGTESYPPPLRVFGIGRRKNRSQQLPEISGTLLHISHMGPEVISVPRACLRADQKRSCHWVGLDFRAQLDICAPCCKHSVV